MLTNEEIQLRLDKLTDDYICTILKPDGYAYTFYRYEDGVDGFAMLVSAVNIFAKNVGKTPFDVIDLLDDAFEKQRGGYK